MQSVTERSRRTLLKVLQLAVSFCVLVLFWLIYPGVLLYVVGAVGLIYVAAALFAMRDALVGIWVAFAFTVMAFAFTLWGVYRYLDNGFSFLSGNFPGRSGVYWPAYLFLFVALGSFVVIVLHLLSRGWMLRRAPLGQRQRTSDAESRRPGVT